MSLKYPVIPGVEFKLFIFDDFPDDFKQSESSSSIPIVAVSSDKKIWGRGKRTGKWFCYPISKRDDGVGFVFIRGVEEPAFGISLTVEYMYEKKYAPNN